MSDDLRQNLAWYRSSRAEVICKKGILKTLAKFTGKHLCQSLSLNEVGGFQHATLLKGRPQQQYFAMNLQKY